MNDSQLADLLDTLNQSSMHMAGVDEAGRGPLAGPVVTAAVILDPESPIEGLADSKKLSAKKRAELEIVIKEKSLCWALGRAEIDEIDELIDGNRCPDIKMQSCAIVKGDQRVEAISAASILAKESRDREMIQLDEEFPGYGFSVHKGYPTRAHIQALAEIGVSSVHRRSYGPVKRML